MPFYDYYDETQSTVYGRWLARVQARYLLTRTCEVQPETKNVLEIGPGRGHFSEACAMQGLCYTAFDINLRILKNIQFRQQHCIQGLSPSLAIADRQYDVAVASHVLEHSISYREALNFIQEMRRIVVPGGLVACVTPDYLALRDDFWNCDYSHGFPTTKRRLRQLLRDTELEPVVLEYIWGPCRGIPGIVAGMTIGSRMVGWLARGLPGKTGEHLYKANLTFARAILALGRVPV